MVTICSANLIFSNSTFCPHSVFMCFVWIWQQTAIISLYNINWLVFISEAESVYCAVRTECLHIIQLNFSLWSCIVHILFSTRSISFYPTVQKVCKPLLHTACFLPAVWPKVDTACSPPYYPHPPVCHTCRQQCYLQFVTRRSVFLSRKTEPTCCYCHPTGDTHYIKFICLVWRVYRT